MINQRYLRERIKNNQADSDYLPILQINAQENNNALVEFLACFLGTFLLCLPFLAYFLNLPMAIKGFGIFTLFYILSIMTLLFIYDRRPEILPQKARFIAQIPVLQENYQLLKISENIFAFLKNAFWLVGDILLATPQLIRILSPPKNKASFSRSRASPKKPPFKTGGFLKYNVFRVGEKCYI